MDSHGSFGGTPDGTVSGAYSYGVAASLPLGNGSCVSLLEYAEEAVLLQQLQQTFDNLGGAGGGDLPSYMDLEHMSGEGITPDQLTPASITQLLQAAN